MESKEHIEKCAVLKKHGSPCRSLPTEISPDDALSLMVNSNLLPFQYRGVYECTMQKNLNIFPSYSEVREAQMLCYPSEIVTTRDSAEVSLQSLVDHTIRRLCESQDEALRASVKENSDISLILKWGCDGAEKKRSCRFVEEVNFILEHVKKESVFSLTMVPIEMCDDIDGSKNVIWRNHASSSVRYCRPIKIVFSDKSEDRIEREIRKVEEQVPALVSTKVFIGTREFSIKPVLIFCTVDSKVCDTISSKVSMHTCFLCGSKPGETNNPDIAEKTVEKKDLSFGLSRLHLWIRFLELILHISCRLDIKSWEIHGERKKHIVGQKKKFIEKEFEKELGLPINVSMEKTGLKNSGVVARKFFRNAATSAAITGVSPILIKRFYVILETLSSNFPLNLDAYNEYVAKTRDLYLKDYAWYPMPISVHKVLYHERDIIRSILPIGQFSEEVHKAHVRVMEEYIKDELFIDKTRKSSIIKDIFIRLLLRSDPFITNMGMSRKRLREDIVSEVMELLEELSVQELTSDDAAESTSDFDTDSEFDYFYH